MKLYHPNFSEPVVLTENETNVIIVENRKIFYSLLSELEQQLSVKEGRYILSNDCNIIELADCTELVSDIIRFEFNEKKLMSKILKKLTDYALGEEYYIKTSEFISAFSAYMEDIIAEADLPLELKGKPDLQAILRAVDLKIQTQSSSLAEKICDYVKLSADFLSNKIFVFINLRQFLSEEDILLIYKFFRYEKLQLILFEGSLCNKLPGEKRIIIDNDLCVI